MRKTKLFIISIISTSLVLIIGIGILLTIIDKESTPVNNVNLFDAYYIYRSDSMNCKIYEKSKQEYTNLNKQIFNGWIYKYAFDSKKKYIAFRSLEYYIFDGDEKILVDSSIYNRYYGGKIYTVTCDTIKLYDCTNKKNINFNDDKSLIDYCKKNSINLCNWYYPAGNGFFQERRTRLSHNCYVKTWLFGYSSIILNDKEIIFGFISDIDVSDNLVTFRLRQTKNDYSPEYIDTNFGLSPLCEKPIGKYKTGFLEYERIYYDKTIIIDTISGKITER